MPDASLINTEVAASSRHATVRHELLHVDGLQRPSRRAPGRTPPIHLFIAGGPEEPEHRDKSGRLYRHTPKKLCPQHEVDIMI